MINDIRHLSAKHSHLLAAQDVQRIFSAHRLLVGFEPCSSVLSLRHLRLWLPPRNFSQEASRLAVVIVYFIVISISNRKLGSHLNPKHDMIEICLNDAYFISSRKLLLILIQAMKLQSLLCLILIVVGATFGVETVRTQIDLGSVLGSIREFGGKRYSSFAGIRYAAPPTGELRFLPPQPYQQPWQGDLVNRPVGIYL